MDIENYKLVYNPENEDVEEILHWLKYERDYINYGLGFYNNKNVILSALNQNRVITLKINNKNIGLVVWSDIENEIVDIDIFTIHPDFRNQGFGRYFYNSIYSYFKKLNYKVLKLFCEPKESELFWKKMELEKIPENIRGINKFSYYKILVQTASTKPMIDSEKIELWNVDCTEVEGKYPIKTWFVDSNEYHLKEPLIYPCDYDWYLRWSKNEEIFFEGEVIYLNDYDEYYRRPFLFITDLIEVF
jgi:hypothetical protein